MEPFLGSEDLLIDMAELCKVFGDSTRIKILCCLFDGEMFVQELADRVGASQSAISHQLRLLKQAKLVKNRRQGKLVGYSLADPGDGKRTFGGGTVTMRKSYALEDLDCANCAAKMEAAINKMPQVEKATVSFMTSRLSLVVPDGTDMAALLEEIQKEIHKVEPDCRIVTK